MINLMHGNCLELMKNIPDQSIDMVLTDPPYGTTACKWDVIIPFDEMWKELKRIIKPNGAILLFGSEPFSSQLRMSNLKMFKYDWIWKKTIASNFLNAKNRPKTNYELIHVFSSGTTANRSKRLMPYFPQGLLPLNKIVNGRGKGGRSNDHGIERPSRKDKILQQFTNYPNQVLEFNSQSKTVHPTQKPVALLEYLIKTYTLENETVLDFTAGSFSTGVACVNLNRKFIGIEKEKKYFDIGVDRIRERVRCLSLEIELAIYTEG